MNTNPRFGSLLGLSTGVCALALLWATTARAQGAGPGPVRFAQAIEHSVRQSVELTGSVEAVFESVLASEVEGLVERIDALPGQPLRKGQRIARLRTALRKIDLDAAVSDHEVALAQLELARSQLARNEDLFRREVISQQAMDDAIRETNRREGEARSAEAAVRRIRYQLDRSSIVAPFDGVLVRKRADVGEWIDPGGAVAEVVALDPLEVVVQVPERYFDRLAVGEPATVRLGALGADTIEGEVRRVVPRADPQARTFEARIQVPNRDGRIGVGMLASVSIALGDVRREVLVPKDAVIRRGPREYLFRIGSDQTVEQIDVSTTRGHADWFGLRPGSVQPGDRVVTYGNERLFPGQPVQAEAIDYALPTEAQP